MLRVQRDMLMRARRAMRRAARKEQARDANAEMDVASMAWPDFGDYASGTPSDPLV